MLSNSSSGTSTSAMPRASSRSRERHRHQRRIHDGEIAIDRADDRHQVKDVARPAPVGQRHDDELVDGVAEQRAQLRDAVVVGAVPAADGHRALVEPHDVAALEPAGRLNRAERSGCRRRGTQRGLRRRLAGPLRLSHAAEDHAARRDDRRVPHVDRVQADVLRPAGACRWPRRPRGAGRGTRRTRRSRARNPARAVKFSAAHSAAIASGAPERVARVLHDEARAGRRPRTCAVSARHGASSLQT